MRIFDILRLASQNVRRRWIRSTLAILTIGVGLAPLALIVSLRQGMDQAATSAAREFSPPPGYGMVYLGQSKMPFAQAKKQISEIPHLLKMDELNRAAHTQLYVQPEFPAKRIVGAPLDFIAERAKIPVKDWTPESGKPAPVLIGKFRLLYTWDHKKNSSKRLDIDPQTLVGKELRLVTANPLGWILPYKWSDDEERYVRLSDEEWERKKKEQEAKFTVKKGKEEVKLGVERKVVIAGVIKGYRIWAPFHAVKQWNQDWFDLKKDFQMGLLSQMASDSNLYRKDILVKFPPGKKALKGCKTVRKMGFWVRNYERRLEQALKTLGTVTVLINAMGIAIIFIGMIALISTITSSIADCTREIGLFRAVGSTRRQIMTIFLGQAGLLGILGAIAGVVIGNLTAVYVNYWTLKKAEELEQSAQLLGRWFSVREADLMPESFYNFEPTYMLFLLGLGFVLSVITAFIPSYRASRQDPIDLLRAD